MAKKPSKGQRLVAKWEKRLGEIATSLEDEFDISLADDMPDDDPAISRANHLAATAYAAYHVLVLGDLP